MSKIYLSFITSGGNLDKIKSMVDPIKDIIDGIVAVFHYPKDEGAEYLESVKKDGKIIYLDWCNRHDFSRNHYLFCGPMQEDDWFIQTDVLEHPNPSFLKEIFASEIAEMDAKIRISQNPAGLGAIYYYGKPYIVKYNRNLKYDGNPHERLLGVSGASVELSNSIPDESLVRKNVRSLYRKDPFHFVNHYAKYYIEYPQSNQIILGLENRCKSSAEYSDKYYFRRDTQKKFLDLLKNKGYDLTVKSAIHLYKNNPLDEELKYYLNKEKIIQDLIRYHVYNERDIKDEHTWTTMKTYE